MGPPQIMPDITSSPTTYRRNSAKGAGGLSPEPGLCQLMGILQAKNGVLFTSWDPLLSWENSYKTGLQVPCQRERGPSLARHCPRWKDRGTHVSSYSLLHPVLSHWTQAEEG